MEDDPPTSSAPPLMPSIFRRSQHGLGRSKGPPPTEPSLGSILASAAPMTVDTLRASGYSVDAVEGESAAFAAIASILRRRGEGLAVGGAGGGGGVEGSGEVGGVSTSSSSSSATLTHPSSPVAASAGASHDPAAQLRALYTQLGLALPSESQPRGGASRQPPPTPSTPHVASISLAELSNSSPTSSVGSGGRLSPSNSLKTRRSPSSAATTTSAPATTAPVHSSLWGPRYFDGSVEGSSSSTSFASLAHTRLEQQQQQQGLHGPPSSTSSSSSPSSPPTTTTVAATAAAASTLSLPASLSPHHSRGAVVLVMDVELGGAPLGPLPVRRCDREYECALRTAHRFCISRGVPLTHLAKLATTICARAERVCAEEALEAEGARKKASKEAVAAYARRVTQTQPFTLATDAVVQERVQAAAAAAAAGAAGAGTAAASRNPTTIPDGEERGCVGGVGGEEQVGSATTTTDAAAAHALGVTSPMKLPTDINARRGRLLGKLSVVVAPGKRGILSVRSGDDPATLVEGFLKAFGLWGSLEVGGVQHGALMGAVEGVLRGGGVDPAAAAAAERARVSASEKRLGPYAPSTTSGGAALASFSSANHPLAAPSSTSFSSTHHNHHNHVSIPVGGYSNSSSTAGATGSSSFSSLAVTSVFPVLGTAAGDIYAYTAAATSTRPGAIITTHLPAPAAASQAHTASSSLVSVAVAGTSAGAAAAAAAIRRAPAKPLLHANVVEDVGLVEEGAAVAAATAAASARNRDALAARAAPRWQPLHEPRPSQHPATTTARHGVHIYTSTSASASTSASTTFSSHATSILSHTATTASSSSSTTTSTSGSSGSTQQGGGLLISTGGGGMDTVKSFFSAPGASAKSSPHASPSGGGGGAAAATSSSTTPVKGTVSVDSSPVAGTGAGAGAAAAAAAKAVNVDSGSPAPLMPKRPQSTTSTSSGSNSPTRHSPTGGHTGPFVPPLRSVLLGAAAPTIASMARSRSTSVPPPNTSPSPNSQQQQRQQQQEQLLSPTASPPRRRVGRGGGGGVTVSPSHSPSSSRPNSPRSASVQGGGGGKGASPRLWKDLASEGYTLPPAPPPPEKKAGVPKAGAAAAGGAAAVAAAAPHTPKIPPPGTRGYTPTTPPLPPQTPPSKQQQQQQQQAAQASKGVPMVAATGNGCSPTSSPGKTSASAGGSSPLAINTLVMGEGKARFNLDVDLGGGRKERILVTHGVAERVERERVAAAAAAAGSGGAGGVGGGGVGIIEETALAFIAKHRLAPSVKAKLTGLIERTLASFKD